MHVNSGANTPHLWNYAYLRVEDMEIHVFLREGYIAFWEQVNIINKFSDTSLEVLWNFNEIICLNINESSMIFLKNIAEISL